MQETWVWSLAGEDPLEKEMVKITWTEESGGPQSMRLQRVGHDWATLSLTLKKILCQGRILDSRIKEYINIPSLSIFPFIYSSTSLFLSIHSLSLRPSVFQAKPVLHLLFYFPSRWQPVTTFNFLLPTNTGQIIQKINAEWREWGRGEGICLSNTDK